MITGEHAIVIFRPVPRPLPARCRVCGRYWRIINVTQRQLTVEHDCPIRMQRDLTQPARWLYPVFSPLVDMSKR